MRFIFSFLLTHHYGIIFESFVFLFSLFPVVFHREFASSGSYILIYQRPGLLLCYLILRCYIYLCYFCMFGSYNSGGGKKRDVNIYTFM